MKQLRLIISLFLLLSLTACAVPKYNYKPDSIDISEPPIGSTNVVYVGDSMLRQGNYTEHDAIYLKQSTYFDEISS